MSRINRFETAYPGRISIGYLGVSPAWWGVTIVASIGLTWAITWMLTHTIV